MTEIEYHIVNKTDPTLFYSNDWGWVDWEHSDTFTEADTNTFNLPMDGKWEEA